METTPPSQPKKRGRPKGSSTKTKEERDKELQHRMRGSITDKKAAANAIDEKYVQWKSLVPVLYDWFANHNLVWPSLSCRWGPIVEQGALKNRQRLYLSEQAS
uniref:WD-40 repeat-containing protein MSI4 n=1 Tax=Nicotiana tabacum TaxID=4097 RepID=A0A1S4DQ86_TOBAC|nr:PREDICTED: WD-40 repeat-containing protein MSI4-like [Nicotiana tabacum]